MSEYIDYQLLGKRIMTERKARGITQEQLAELLGFNSPSYLSQIENGRRKTGLPLIMKIAKHLGCDYIYLLSGTIRNEAVYLNAELNSFFRDKTPDEKKHALEILETVFKPKKP